MAAPHNILMLAFPDAQLLDIAGPLQMFAGANDELSRSAYRIRIAAPEAGPFSTSSGIRLVADVAFAQVNSKQLARTHTLIAAGGNDGVCAELKRGAITEIIVTAAGRVARIASVCSGAFFLAAAGVLDGRRATTHWRAVEALRRFRPAIDVDGDAIHVEDGGVWTSAGVTAGMDLALAMIEADHGRAVALAVARRHVVFRIRPGGQSQFSAELAAQSPSNARIRALAEKVARNPQGHWRTDVLAMELGVSQRSLSRHFRASLECEPRRLCRAGSHRPGSAQAAGNGRHDRDNRHELRIRLPCAAWTRAFARLIAVSPTEFRARISVPLEVGHASSLMSASSSSLN